ncbi:MAG: hypothetical protein KBG28_27800 [Kofleriaceae bacterium]|nr:hypothetical protein [Kofleriaceae bacterium]
MQGPSSPRAPDHAAGAAGRIVIVHGDRKSQRALARMAGAALCPVEVVDDLAAAAAPVDATTVVIIDQALAQATPDLPRHLARAWIAVPGEGLAAGDPDVIARLIGAGWRHVIAHPMPVLAEELLATIQKHLRRDLFGLDKYVAWSAEVRHLGLDDARERDDAVTALSRDITRAGLPERLGSLGSVIADELLANAIFTAPVDADGRRPHRTDARDGARALTGVGLGWATDGRYLAIAVTDAWGSIDPAALARRLGPIGQVAAADPVGGTGGDGGMGLPLAYACCNQLVINVEPGRRSEVIALIDVRYRPTELARSGSFHLFT